MASIATIKGVSPDVWKLFKAEAARHGTTMGELFNRIIRQHAEDDMTREEAFAIMDAAREKGGKYPASAEVLRWRKKHLF